MSAKASYQLTFDGSTDAPPGYADRSRVFLDRRANQSEGSGDDQIDRVFGVVLTVPQGGNVSFDLQDALDQANAAITLTDVKWISIEAASDNEQIVTMLPHATDGWTSFMPGTAPTKALPPGKLIFEASTGDGDLVVGPTDKVLQFTAGAGVDQTVTIKLVGSQ